MKYSIRSFLKTKEGFLPIEECMSPPEDHDYIEGGLIWSVGTSQIISLEHWDLVDQLWAYIIRGLASVAKGSDFTTYFPDQPLLLLFRSVTRNDVAVTVGKQTSVVGRDEFFKSLSAGATHFAKELIRLVPETRSTWELLRADLDALSE